MCIFIQKLAKYVPAVHQLVLWVQIHTKRCGADTWRATLDWKLCNKSVENKVLANHYFSFCLASLSLEHSARTD
jgi:hypothetical protein